MRDGPGAALVRESDLFEFGGAPTTRPTKGRARW